MKLKKIIFIIIPFLLTAIIIGYTPEGKKADNASYMEKKEKYDLNKYLDENHTEINLDTGSGFNLLDEDIKKNDVILTGEYSNVSSNYQVKLSLLKYLNKNYGVRYLLEDMSYSESWMINAYLKSGDESIFNLVQNVVDFKNFSDFWIKVKEYNDTLPESKRISVIGINLEYNKFSSFLYITMLAQGEPGPDIKPYIKAYKEKYSRLYKDMNPKNWDEVTKAVLDLENNVEANPVAYEKYFGSRFFDFSLIAVNFVKAYKVNQGEVIDYEEFDERSLFSSLKKIYSTLPKGKYFGQFEMKHVYQNRYVGMKYNNNFAMLLNGSGSPVAGRVLSIAYDYDNCKALSKQFDNSEENVGTQFNEHDLLKSTSKSDLSLFKLNGDKSPFSNKSILVTGKDNTSDMDYFKYIILIRNSKAAASY